MLFSGKCLAKDLSFTIVELMMNYKDSNDETHWELVEPAISERGYIVKNKKGKAVISITNQMSDIIRQDIGYQISISNEYNLETKELVNQQSLNLPLILNKTSNPNYSFTEEDLSLIYNININEKRVIITYYAEQRIPENDRYINIIYVGKPVMNYEDENLMVLLSNNKIDSGDNRGKIVNKNNIDYIITNNLITRNINSIGWNNNFFPSRINIRDNKDLIFGYLDNLLISTDSDRFRNNNTIIIEDKEYFILRIGLNYSHYVSNVSNNATITNSSNSFYNSSPYLFFIPKF